MPEGRLARRWRRFANEAIHRTRERIAFYGAIAPGTRRAEQFGSFGPGSVVAYPTGAIYGEAHIHVGATSMVSPQVTLTAGYSPEQTTVPPRALVIGDRAVIGVRSAIIAHESIEIGDDVWFGPEVFVTDANHGYQDPEVPIGRQLGLHEPVRIGSGSWLGCRVVVLPGTTIGRQCVIAAGSVVRGDIPDHSVVAGVPGRILRQYRPGLGWPRVDLGVDADGLPIGFDAKAVTEEMDPDAVEASELDAGLAELQAELDRYRTNPVPFGHVPPSDAAPTTD